MEENRSYEEEIVIDLKELIYTLLDKWLMIVISAFLCALIGMCASMFLMPEKFQSKTSIYIYNQQDDGMTYSDLQTGSTLTKDYEVLIKGRTVLESVIEKLDLDLSYGDLYGMVSVSVPDSTRIVEITVETTDPYLSREIADEVRETASANIAEVMGVDAVNVVEKANLPDKKSGPSIKKYTVLGGMAGGVLVCGIIVILFLFNDTIRTQDDVERYLGLSTLGIIPVNENANAGKKKRRFKKQKNAERGNLINNI